MSLEVFNQLMEVTLIAIVPAVYFASALMKSDQPSGGRHE